MGELERNRLSEREKHLLKLRLEKLSESKEGEVNGEDGVEGSVVAADGSSRPTGKKKNVKRNQNPLGVADRHVFKRKRVKVLIISGLLNCRICRMSLNWTTWSFRFCSSAFSFLSLKLSPVA